MIINRYSCFLGTCQSLIIMHSVRLADSIDAPSTESYVEIEPDVPDKIGIANKVTAIGYIKLILPPLFEGTSSVIPHCILVAFGGENYGEYARSLKRFSFIAIQYLRWLWTFLGISNSGITVFSSDLLETVVTTTKSQNI